MNFIKKHYLLIIIGLVMINNIEHLAYVHHDISRKLFGHEGSMIHSIIVVVIIELSIMAFVINGKKTFALFFTIALFVLSMLYYDLRAFIAHGNWEQLISSTVYSTLFTIAIYMFSDMYNEKANDDSPNGDSEQNNLIQVQRDLNESELQLNEHKERNEELETMLEESGKSLKVLTLNSGISQKALSLAQSELDALHLEIKDLQKISNAWMELCTCKHCGKLFDNPNANRVHQGRCAKNPKTIL
ncbi:hypothetical protein [Aureibacter tunicatorum]|uniref:Uncharacterized protein n=1 Tax=Aureibacter tunicatorum TaxID=866807 RepID=A0AAE4BS83_9BACT|nr:hypothetical protein [Aureibacter tunicatorum]MDR6240954.1 hypothetical protein [Aureibacter tunicatorum]